MDGRMLNRILGEFEQAKERLDRAKEEQKQAQAKFDHLSQKVLPEALIEAGIATVDDAGNYSGSCTTPSGMKVYLRNELYANVRKDDMDTVIRWLKRRRLGDLATTTINYQTLNAFVRQRLEEAGDRATKGQEVLPPEVNITTVVKATLRKS